MKLHRFSIGVSLLGVVVVVAWIFLSSSRTPTETAPAPSVSLPEIAQPVAVASPIPTSAPLPEDTQTLNPPPAPAALTTAVVPGMPMVRTTGTSPRRRANVTAPTLPSQAEVPSEAEADLEAILLMLRDFRTRLGENPVGSNAEIMRAVMGGNEAKARLGPPSGQQLNEGGELVDRWGTPYFFHQLSKTSMEIRSAGPDARLWTVDDVVTK